MTAACESYFQDEDERDAAGETARPPAAQEEYAGPRTLDGRPAPQSSSSRGARQPAPQPKKRGVAGIATLGSLGGSSHQHDDHDDDDDDDDDEDDGRGNLFAGGEKSGLAVQDPNQPDGGPRKLINDILAKAKA